MSVSPVVYWTPEHSLASVSWRGRAGEGELKEGAREAWRAERWVATREGRREGRRNGGKERGRAGGWVAGVYGGVHEAGWGSDWAGTTHKEKCGDGRTVRTPRGGRGRSMDRRGGGGKGGGRLDSRNTEARKLEICEGKYVVDKIWMHGQKNGVRAAVRTAVQRGGEEGGDGAIEEERNES